jgi:hypothetical protein
MVAISRVVLRRYSPVQFVGMDEVQMLQGHWAMVDLIGKGGHIRTAAPLNLYFVPSNATGSRIPTQSGWGLR